MPCIALVMRPAVTGRNDNAQVDARGTIAVGRLAFLLLLAVPQRPITRVVVVQPAEATAGTRFGMVAGLAHSVIIALKKQLPNPCALSQSENIVYPSPTELTLIENGEHVTAPP
jgi:hypothetical protein